MKTLIDLYKDGYDVRENYKVKEHHRNFAFLKDSDKVYGFDTFEQLITFIYWEDEKDYE